MKKRKVICSFMITAVLIMGMTACGQESGQASASGASGSAEPGTSQEEAQTGSEGDGAEKTGESRDILGIGAETLFGKITSIEGSTVTLALAEQTGIPDGREPSEKQNSDWNTPADNQKPDRSAPTDNQKPAEALTGGGNVESGGQPPAELKLTGEIRELTVTDETIITINNASVSLSELSVDDVITAFMEEDTLNSIAVGGFSAERGRDRGLKESDRENPVSESSNVEADAT